MLVRYLGKDYEPLLIHGSIYRAVGENTFFYCIVDGIGGENLFPKELFEIVS